VFDSERPAVHDFAADMDSEVTVARDSESEPAQARKGVLGLSARLRSPSGMLQDLPSSCAEPIDATQ
jgi:hypothetical protein